MRPRHQPNSVPQLIAHLPQLNKLWVVEGRCDFPSRDGGQVLDAVKVGVLDGHDAGLGKDLLGEVVDELTVDKNVDAVVDYLLALAPASCCE